MAPILLLILIFILGLTVLIKGADWFTIAAEKVALRFRISPYIVGVTIVSIGTSLPELASSIAAVIQGDSAIVAGNVIGSNIANSLLVLGVGAVIAGRLTTKWDLRRVDFPLLFGATFLLALMAWNGSFNWTEACFMLFGLGIYLHYLYCKHLSGEFAEELPKPAKNERVLRHIILPLLIGAVMIYFGAEWTVKAVIDLATLTGISSSIIATTAVALGTSLPELMVTVMAARKGKYEIAIGNVMGSNLFNIFGIMGISGLFGTLVVRPELLTFALPVLVGATFMFYFVTNDKEISRWEGWTLILLYTFFVAKMFL